MISGEVNRCFIGLTKVIIDRTKHALTDIRNLVHTLIQVNASSQQSVCHKVLLKPVNCTLVIFTYRSRSRQVLTDYVCILTDNPTIHSECLYDIARPTFMWARSVKWGGPHVFLEQADMTAIEKSLTLNNMVYIIIIMFFVYLQVKEITNVNVYIETVDRKNIYHDLKCSPDFQFRWA